MGQSFYPLICDNGLKCFEMFGCVKVAVRMGAVGGGSMGSE